jgi:enoyl-CoA hydratase
MEKTETIDQQRSETIELAVRENIAYLKFTQPEKANAMTKAFWSDFPKALDHLAAQNNVRALIISGEGKHFSSGMDLSVFSKNENLNTGTARERERLRGLVLHLQGIFSKLESLRFPVIAAIQGACIGGALDLVCACDMRYASRNAYFCVQETNLAMMADLGVLQRLPKLIPSGIARELCFTGEKLLADRAYELGLVSSVFETEEQLYTHVKSVAQLIASKSPLAIAATKEAINFARDNSVNSALSHAALMQSSLLDGWDLANAATAISKKGTAEFEALLAAGSL